MNSVYSFKRSLKHFIKLHVLIVFIQLNCVYNDIVFIITIIKYEQLTTQPKY